MADRSSRRCAALPPAIVVRAATGSGGGGFVVAASEAGDTCGLLEAAGAPEPAHPPRKSAQHTTGPARLRIAR
jgi:hypothetical protein